MPTNSVNIHAGKFQLFPVRIHDVQFWLALDAHKFSKELQQTFCELPIKQFCLISVGYLLFYKVNLRKKKKTDKFKIFKCLKNGNKTFQKEIFSNKDCRQKSKRIYAAKLSRNFRKDLC